MSTLLTSSPRYVWAKRKITCPACGRVGRFRHYIDTRSETVLPLHVGVCDRVNACGYKLSPEEFCGTLPAGTQDKKRLSGLDKRFPDENKRFLQPEITFIPYESYQKAIACYPLNNLFRFFSRHFGANCTDFVFRHYWVGTSHMWKCYSGMATAFPQIDWCGRLRQVKIMIYNPETGKRLKAGESCLLEAGGRYIPDSGLNKVRFIGKKLISRPEANLKQCFFGEHLLTKHPDKPVAIVESEKTALAMAVCWPEYLWLATGGSHGCRWNDPLVFAPLKNRKVSLFPDLKMTGEWKEKATRLTELYACTILINDFCELFATEKEKSEGLDIWDFIQQHESQNLSAFGSAYYHQNLTT